MNYTYLHYQIGLTLLCGIGPIKARELLERVCTPEAVFQLSERALHAQTGLSKKMIKKMKRKQALEQSVPVVSHLQQHRIRPLFFDDPGYPHRLKHCPDAPLMLYQKGPVDLNQRKVVAVVGTRTATRYGQRLVNQLIKSFQEMGIVVISGLAHGVDTFAHGSCLEYGVQTVGVLGHGFDRIYPARNRSLAKQMLANGGLLTEFIPGTDPDRENFPKRNRIVAGISDAVIVVESKEQGGSLITANLANDYNRDVFAFPGAITSEMSLGCNALIANNQAHLLRGPEHFLEVMNWKESNTSKSIQKKAFPQLSERQQLIVETLRSTHQLQIDVLSMRSSLPISELNQELFHLELEGVIQQLPGKTYALT